MSIQARFPHIPVLREKTMGHIQAMTVAKPTSPSFSGELNLIVNTALDNNASIGYRMWALKARMGAFRANLPSSSPKQLKQIDLIEALASAYIRYRAGDLSNSIKETIVEHAANAKKWLSLYGSYPIQQAVLDKETGEKWITALNACLIDLNTNQSDQVIFYLFKTNMLGLCRVVMRHSERAPHSNLLHHFGFIEQETMKGIKSYIVSLFTLISMQNREQRIKPFDPLESHDPAKLQSSKNKRKKPEPSRPVKERPPKKTELSTPTSTATKPFDPATLALSKEEIELWLTLSDSLGKIKQ